MVDPNTCDHDNAEELAEGVQWCPDCGTRWAVDREAIQRVHDLFMQKLAARHPDHPWVRLDIVK